jgi:hypothetical protein
MSILRHRRTEGAQNRDLSRRVVDVIITPEHVGHAHIPIVDHHAKIVGRRAIGAGDDEVIEFAVIEGDGPLDHIDPASRTVLWAFEAHHRLAI